MASNKDYSKIFKAAAKLAGQLPGKALRAFTIPAKEVDYERAKSEYDQAKDGFFVMSHFALLGGALHHNQTRKSIDVNSEDGERIIDIKKRAMEYAATDLVYEYALDGKVYDIDKKEVTETFDRNTDKGQQIIIAAKTSRETALFYKDHANYPADHNIDSPDNSMQ